MIIASQLKPGMAIRVEGQIYRVLGAEFHAGGGQQVGVVKTKLRNALSGTMWEPRFRPDERLEDLALQRRTMQFLYRDQENCFFMNPFTYDQVEVSRAALGPAERFLKEEMQIPLDFYENRPIGVVLPPVMDVRVTSTGPAVHSQQDSTWKEAVLENDMMVKVPLFIETGETIRVEVETGRYVERVRAEKKRF
jgi:elongation factor P